MEMMALLKMLVMSESTTGIIVIVLGFFDDDIDEDYDKYSLLITKGHGRMMVLLKMLVMSNMDPWVNIHR